MSGFAYAELFMEFYDSCGITLWSGLREFRRGNPGSDRICTGCGGSGYYYARNDDVLVRNHGDREAGGTFGMVYTENESALKFPFPGSETGSSGTRSDCS